MNGTRRQVSIASHGRLLEGDLLIPPNPRAVVICVPPTGARRREPAFHFMGRILNAAGFAALLLDVRTAEEEALEEWTRQRRPEVELIASRLTSARSFVSFDDELGGLTIGLYAFGSTAAGALTAAAWEPAEIFCVVSCGGRPEDAGEALSEIYAPVLLVSGTEDPSALQRNERACGQLRGICEVAALQGDTHRLSRDPQLLAQLAPRVTDFFERFLSSDLEAPLHP